MALNIATLEKRLDRLAGSDQIPPDTMLIDFISPRETRPITGAKVDGIEYPTNPGETADAFMGRMQDTHPHKLIFLTRTA